MACPVTEIPMAGDYKHRDTELRDSSASIGRKILMFKSKDAGPSVTNFTRCQSNIFALFAQVLYLGENARSDS